MAASRQGADDCRDHLRSPPSISCIDGRGFGVRREDMRRMLLKTEGKVFTLKSLDQLVEHTLLRDFLPK